MTLPARVRMVEVGPRDGLQNEPRPVPTAVRIGLVDRLSETGLEVIEAGAFVSPERVPQMADSAAVFAGIRRRPGVRYAALTPNLRGVEAALAAGADEVAVFAAATETFSERNLGVSIAGSLERFGPALARAKAAGVPVRGYVSCALGCPYEGSVDPSNVADVAARLWTMGCFEISLGDTIGAGTPETAAAMLAAVAARVPVERLALHFHDTGGRALDNIRACLERGAAVVDSSVAGLGGCPFAPGAPGNVASEAVAALLERLGIATGVDRARLAAAGAWLRGLPAG